jgi:putative zinc finger protein
MEAAVNLVCHRVRSQVSLDLDGGLSELERMMVSRHVERCADCRAFHDGVTQVAEQMRNAPLEPFRRSVVLPRLHRGRILAARDIALRVSATAAGVALVLGLGLSERGVLEPGGRSDQARAAYLDSPNTEQKIIRELRDYRLVQSRSDIRPI